MTAKGKVLGFRERRLERALEADDYRAAIQVLEEIQADRPLHPHELVQLGILIQLGDEDGPPLSLVESSYKKAIELDSAYVPALLELGWFNYAVNDRSEVGKEFFERALTLLDEMRAEAEKGIQDCLEDLSFEQ